MAATIFTGKVFEDSGGSALALVTDGDGDNIQIADVSSITHQVTDKFTGTSIASGSLTVATVVFDTLQTKTLWTQDSTGYNFRYDVPASSFPTGNRTYVLEVAFTPASGQVYHAVWEIYAKHLHIT